MPVVADWFVPPAPVGVAVMPVIALASVMPVVAGPVVPAAVVGIAVAPEAILLLNDAPPRGMV